MKAKDFEQIDNNFTETVKNTLHSKGNEYSTCDNKMWNFKYVSKVLELWLEIKLHYGIGIVTEAEAAFILSLKHDASIVKLLALAEQVPASMLQEKFGDKHAYNSLTHAIMRKIYEQDNDKVEV